MSKYDSKKDTLKHIETVGVFIESVIKSLRSRALNHDASKLNLPEKPYFDEYTPKLKDCTYGSDEYKGYLKELNVALKHHYSNNRHHPEHFKNGISGMNLIDITEMLCDWKAATLRHNDGDLMRSIELNQNRFGYSDELKSIFINTAKDLYKYYVDYGSSTKEGWFVSDTVEGLHLQIDDCEELYDVEKQLVKYGQCGTFKNREYYNTRDVVDNCFCIEWKVNY